MGLHERKRDNSFPSGMTRSQQVDINMRFFICADCCACVANIFRIGGNSRSRLILLGFCSSVLRRDDAHLGIVF